MILASCASFERGSYAPFERGGYAPFERAGCASFERAACTFRRRKALIRGESRAAIPSAVFSRQADVILLRKVEELSDCFPVSGWVEC